MRVMRGVVHGKTVEFPDEIGLSDGQEVNVTMEPVLPNLPSGEGIRRSAGAWADDADDLDEYLEWNRNQRKLSRPELET